MAVIIAVKMAQMLELVSVFYHLPRSIVTSHKLLAKMRRLVVGETPL